MAEMREQGYTLRYIGAKFSLSAERTRKVLLKAFSPTTRKTSPEVWTPERQDCEFEAEYERRCLR